MGTIFAVTNIKGGVGKSTTSQGLAAHLAMMGKKVLLVDGDSQRTTSEWSQWRADNDEFFNISCIELSGKIHETLVSMSADYDAVVVDCGGADSITARSTLVVADVALIPCTASKRDYMKLHHTADVLETAKIHNALLQVFGVVTKAPHLINQAPRILLAKANMSKSNITPLQCFFINRLAIDDISEVGGAIQESGDDKAMKEAVAVFDELLAAI